ncbi:MAG: hypothetical protein U0414_24320 [Polyangiaceae bacterium]
MTAEDARDPIAALDAFLVDDLALADGAARGDPRALARFDRAFGEEMDRAIRKSPTLGLTAEEFRQIIRELFVAAPGRSASNRELRGALPSSGGSGHVRARRHRSRAARERP